MLCSFPFCLVMLNFKSLCVWLQEMLADPQTSYSTSLYAVLRKAQLLVSLRVSACSRIDSIFNELHKRGSGKLIRRSWNWGEIPTAADRRVAGVGWGYFRNPPPSFCAVLWCWPFLSEPPYIKEAISRRTGWHPRNGHRHHLLTKCQGEGKPDTCRVGFSLDFVDAYWQI